MKKLTSLVICLACTVLAPPPLGGGPQLALAAPVPPELIVNHDAAQCASFFPGDECSYAVMPAGWVSLGFEGDAQCPAGYEFVEIDVEYRGIKDEHCCSEWGSGAPGNCDDMVINRRAKQCAFVEDREGCFLPAGWAKYPADGSHWECPGEYSWIDDLPCMTEEEAGRAGQWAPWLVVAVVLVAAGGLTLCAVLVWLFVRRRG